MPLTLYTSGSTKEPKQVFHPSIDYHISRSLKETQLSASDIVLDVFPSNVIAHYTITAQPALAVGAHLISANFEPYNYIKLFKEFQPTFISLIPRHLEILEKTKGWEDLDMSCVRYMVTGSGNITQNIIDAFRNRGVQLVANWYGMTEMPPPVLIGYNSERFNFNVTNGYNVEFTDQGECVINGFHTGDLFDLENNTFLKRKQSVELSTWKTNV
jgi:long-subunit acyl-CoA synthetase (AMP-forming)